MLESLEVYRALVEGASDGIAIIQDTRLVYVNARLLAILGLREDEPLGRPFTDYVAPGEVEKVAGHYRTRLSGGDAPQTYETLMLHASGRPVPVEVNACVLQFRGATATMAVIRDASERRRAMEVLRESEERFRHLADLLPQTIFEIDLAGTFLYANRHGFETFGVSPETIGAGVNVAQVFEPRERERVVKNMRRVIEGLPVDDHEYVAMRPDGSTFPVHVFSTPILRDGAPVGLRGVVVDITEIRRAQEQLRQAEEQYRQAQKLEAIGLLAGGIAHDFNNVIATIKMQAYLARKKLDAGHPARTLVEQIEETTERAGSLTSKLLAFGRKRVIAPRPTDINAVVSGMCDMLRRLIGEKTELVTVLAPDIGLARVDGGQIEQVVVNLVMNARDAMPDGGRLVVETARAELGDDHVGERALAKPGSYVRLGVSDTGVGMDEATRVRHFEPYFTTKDVGKGSGLGLPIVYGIVTQSGGYVWIYSEPGRGTTVKAYFPRVDAAGSVSTRAARRAERPGRGETVLVVEDEDGLRRAAREALESAGYRTLEARDGVDAMRVLAEYANPVHLVLTDVVMPRMNGGELARRARELFPAIKVIYMSGYTADAFDANSGPVPDGTFIEKPFAPDALLGTVRDVLDEDVRP